MKLFYVAGMLMGMMIAQCVVAAEFGTALKADAIKKEPFSDAQTVATLAVGDKVTILKKDGGWLRVKAGKGTGWVRMLSIRKGDAKNDKGIAGSLKGLASGRSGTGSVVATTGIRGLSEEELRGAKFDAQQLNLADSFLTTRTEAQVFASQAKLTPRSFDYLPVAE
jgi:uncharacterized protein YgiM (DUF1202 family)